jgi:hypothetical protein
MSQWMHIDLSTDLGVIFKIKLSNGNAMNTVTI